MLRKASENGPLAQRVAVDDPTTATSATGSPAVPGVRAAAGITASPPVLGTVGEAPADGAGGGAGAGGARCAQVGPEADEEVGEGDPDGADLAAGAAQRRGLGEVPALGAARQQRRQHGAHRAAVDGVVGVAADPAVDGADVEAGAAAD